jgi:hypothetical protein
MPDRVHFSTLTPMQAGGCMTFAVALAPDRKNFARRNQQRCDRIV